MEHSYKNNECNHEIAPYQYCLNCGSELQGMYCYKCGQCVSNSFALRVKLLVIFCALLLGCCTCFSQTSLYEEARSFQRNRQYDEAIDGFKQYLLLPVHVKELTDDQLGEYTDALMQLMNTYQSKGEPEACIQALQEIYRSSSLFQNQCLRDYYSVLGYALSRTERMDEAEKTTLNVFDLPLYRATPERLFRDYAYAAAVFYSNPLHQEQTIKWCEQALKQIQENKNISGKQWVTTMLGSLYKRNGYFSQAIDLFQQSRLEAQSNQDGLGELNSLHALSGLFLYWNVPEYANLYASEALRVAKGMSIHNPMIFAQSYIQKGFAMYQLGYIDSVPDCVNHARKYCKSLPYNSGMVDVDLLSGYYLTHLSGDSLQMGIQHLMNVAQQGTAVNQAKAYHQLAQTYLQIGEGRNAESMLDSMYILLHQTASPVYIQIQYEPILNYLSSKKNAKKVEQYAQLMNKELAAFKAKNLNLKIAEAVVDLKINQERQQLLIMQLKLVNQRLWFLVGVCISIFVAIVIAALYLHQKKQNKIRFKQAEMKMSGLMQKLNDVNAEKEKVAQEMNELLTDKSSRQEIETITPSMLHKNGESKFRQRFELLYPFFLPNLRERVPAITRREELLCMLIVLKQDNKEIADLMAIAPRSVLMLRHRFRQKIEMSTEESLEEFIDEIMSL